MTSTELINGGDGGGRSDRDDQTVVEMVSASPSDSVSEEQAVPLLIPKDRPKINIFSLSYPIHKLNKEPITKLAETEASSFSQFMMWAWSGSRYSGLLCMALSSTIYCIMEVISDLFSVQSIPLLQTASTRCGIVSILSFVWLRRNGQPMFGPSSAKKFLVSRAVTGYLSLLAFVYCIQILPMSQAIVLSFTTPIIASLAARAVLHEKLELAEIGGLACSFFGILFIFHPMFVTQGWLEKGAKASDSQGSRHYLAALVGLFSSISGGISYCLIRAGAKASDQPVSTVLSFGLLASPVSLICSFALKNFVLPGLYSFFLMILLGIMAFFAEVLLARGLQLEKTSKVANILYIEAALSQLWGMSSSRVIPSFGRLVGCLLIFISAGYTMYTGPEKDN